MGKILAILKLPSTNTQMYIVSYDKTPKENYGEFIVTILVRTSDGKSFS